METRELSFLSFCMVLSCFNWFILKNIFFIEYDRFQEEEAFEQCFHAFQKLHGSFTNIFYVNSLNFVYCLKLAVCMNAAWKTFRQIRLWCPMWVYLTVGIPI